MNMVERPSASDEHIAHGVLYRVEGGQNLRLPAIDGHSMLVMRRRLAVTGAAGPAVILDDDVAAAQVDHRLDSDAKAVLDQGACAAAPEVGHLRIFVHLAPDSVATHLAHHGVTPLLAIGLYGVGDVAQAIALATGFDARVKRLFGSLQQLHHLRGHLSNRESVTHVAVVAVELDDKVNTDNVTLTQGVGGGESMHHRLVDFDAERGGETAVTQACRTAAVLDDELAGDGVELVGCDSGTYQLCHLSQCEGGQLAGAPHLFNFVGSLEVNHLVLERVGGNFRVQLPAGKGGQSLLRQRVLRCQDMNQ